MHTDHESTKEIITSKNNRLKLITETDNCTAYYDTCSGGMNNNHITINSCSLHSEFTPC